ncbi:MAG: hypothetical protein NTV74_06390 [Euryarchaeota archaeon]|nr:hypothetical protein [Euryarchaeota archaeon]
MEKTNFGKIKLGRLAIAVAICVLMVTTSMATAMISLRTDRQTNPIVNNLSYTFLFKEPSFKSIQASGSGYTEISMQGCMAIGKQAGEPLVPVKLITLLLPPKKAVASINVVGTPIEIESNINFLEKPVFPYQKPVPIGSNEPQEFIINKDVYSSAASYPSAVYTDYHIGYSHGYAILDFGLNPMQYTPKDGTLVYYPEMTVTINLKDTDYVTQFFSNNPSDETYVKTLVSNPDLTQLYQTSDVPTFEYPGGLCDPSQHFDYVIVTTTQNGLDYWDVGGTLTYNWDSLIAEHNNDGLTTTVVTKQDIDSCTDYQNSDPLFNDGQAHIREFCKDAYEDWGTRYILIAGDSDTLPARQLYYSYEGNVDSDIYWSNLDNNFNADHDNRWGEEADSGFDLYSEIFIGRITCDNPQDASNWMTKSFYYADSAEDTYLDNAAFYGGDTTWNCQGDDFIDYSAIKGTNNWLGPNPGTNGPFPTWAGFQYGFETWNAVNSGNQFDLSVKWTAEPPNSGWQGGSTSAAITGLKNAINNDQVTLISGIAHANPSMSLDVYDTEWESQYTNTKPFFITDYGCHSGDFDDGDGVLESMLFHSNTELAFGCVYNTGYGWGQFDDTNSSSAFQQKQFWNYFFNMENYSGDYSNWQLGKGHAWSKDTMAPTINWDYSYGTWRGVIECCLLFGDPAQAIKSPHPSEPPAQPTKPAGRTYGLWNLEYTYTSGTTDPNGDQIYYLFDWGDGTSDWVGPYSSGQTGTASHIWTVLGTYEVKVKARDVWGAGSIWSNPLIVTISDNTPPNNPTITGPDQVKPLLSYLFLFNATDNDTGQQLYYAIDWGDGNGAVGLGPYDSGEAVHFTHSWNLKGDYVIKARVTDEPGADSEWVYFPLVVSMSIDIGSSSNQLFGNLVLKGANIGGLLGNQLLQNLMMRGQTTNN